jgi:hypothetical protein
MNSGGLQVPGEHLGVVTISPDQEPTACGSSGPERLRRTRYQSIEYLLCGNGQRAEDNSVAVALFLAADVNRDGTGL